MSSGKLDMHATTIHAQCSELRQMHDLGNQMALYELLSFCRVKNAALPDWAVEPLQKIVAEFHVGKSPGVAPKPKGSPGKSKSPLGQ